MALPTAQNVLDREPPPPSTWQALTRRDGETTKGHAAFIDYALMGPGRSLRKLCDRYRGQKDGEPGAEKPPTTRVATLEEWSAKHEWQKRIAAWDKERQQVEQAHIDTRRRALLEANWETGEALRGLAADILAQAPNFLKTTRKLVKGHEGQPDREVITLGIDIAAMLKALALANEFQQQAVGMPQKSVDVTSGGESVGVTVDLSNLSIEQLTALAKTLSP